MAAITGWGRGTWSQGPWDEAIPVVVTGEAATGAVGSVVVAAEANIPVTGIASTGSIGSVVVIANANVDVTGETATGSVGSVAVTADAVVFTNNGCMHRSNRHNYNSCKSQCFTYGCRRNHLCWFGGGLG